MRTASLALILSCLALPFLASCSRPGENILDCTALLAKRVNEPLFLQELMRSVVIHYAESGQFDKAIELAESDDLLEAYLRHLKGISGSNKKLIEQRAGSFKNELLAEVAQIYAKSGRYDEALRLAQTIDEPYYKADALIKIAAKQADLKLIQEASAKLSEAMELSRSSAGASDNTLLDKNSLWADIADNYARIGQYDQAIQAAKVITKSDVEIRTLTVIAKQLAMSGQTDRALELLTRVTQLNSNPNSMLMSPEVASVYAKSGEVDKANEFLAQASQLARSRYDWKLLTQIADTQAEIGQYDQAIQTAQSLGSESGNEALLKIARRFAQARQFDKAVDLTQTVERLSPKVPAKVTAWVETANNYAASGQADKASAALAQATELARGIDDPESKALNLAKVAIKYAELGQNEKASEVVFQALQAVTAIDLKSSRNMVMEIDDRKSTLTLDGTTVRVMALNDIADAYIKAGQKTDEKTKKVLAEICQ